MKSKTLFLVGFLYFSAFSLLNGADERCMAYQIVNTYFPSLALHAFDLALLTNSSRWYCIDQSCPTCVMVFEVVTTCDSDGNPDSLCPGYSPYMINDEPVVYDDCQVSIKEGIKNVRCSYICPDELHLYWNDEEDLMDTKLRSAFTVRNANRTQQGNYENIFEVFDMVTGYLSLREETKKEFLYVTIVLPDNRLKHLERITSPTGTCEYDLYAGAMLNTKLITNDVLIHIKDSQPLFGAPLVAAVYTIQVPFPCNPTIEISLDEELDWKNISQIICEGAAFVTPAGFDGMEIVYEGYYLQHFIYCPDHLIDIQLFMFYYHGGHLKMVFLDWQQQEIDVYTRVFDEERTKTFNETFPGAYGVIVHWEQGDATRMGFLMEVRVFESAYTPGTTGSTIEEEETTKMMTTTTSKPMSTVKAATTTQPITTVVPVTKGPTTTVPTTTTMIKTRTTSSMTSTITSLAVYNWNLSLFPFYLVIFYIIFHSVNLIN